MQGLFHHSTKADLIQCMRMCKIAVLQEFFQFTAAGTEG